LFLIQFALLKCKDFKSEEDQISCETFNNELQLESSLATELSNPATTSAFSETVNFFLSFRDDAIEGIIVVTTIT
jgi:hypothetical protein